VKTAEKITRATQPSGDLTPAVIQSTFAGPKSYAAVASGSGDQTKIVLLVTDSTVPPFFAGAPEMAQVEQQVSGQLANDLLSQYVSELQSQLGVAVNQTALQQLLGAPNS
jgi:peptidyl-prolyl cis-trans isomerase D